MNPRAVPCWLHLCTWALAFLTGQTGWGQQVPDLEFNPPLARPAFPVGKGPVIAIDEAHFNFHTIGGRYAPFAKLVQRDGYVVRASAQPFSAASLAGVWVLVIANALNERNQREWSLPTPSAFSSDEIAAVKQWVADGGALLLIVDHMPFPGCNQALAAVFGFTFSNGFAENAAGQTLLHFSRSGGTLGEHRILHGRAKAEEVTDVVAFTGSAFRPPKMATSLFTFPAGSISREPQIAWRFTDDTKKTEINGWSQGAVMEFGRGRVAVFGEAAMFSAQHSGTKKSPMGMNAPAAKQNAQFLLNVLHWLTRVLE